jgi:hypothetical protein
VYTTRDVWKSCWRLWNRRYDDVVSAKADGSQLHHDQTSTIVLKAPRRKLPGHTGGKRSIVSAKLGGSTRPQGGSCLAIQKGRDRSSSQHTAPGRSLPCQCCHTGGKRSIKLAAQGTRASLPCQCCHTGGKRSSRQQQQRRWKVCRERLPEPYPGRHQAVIRQRKTRQPGIGAATLLSAIQEARDRSTVSASSEAAQGIKAEAAWPYRMEEIDQAGSTRHQGARLLAMLPYRREEIDQSRSTRHQGARCLAMLPYRREEIDHARSTRQQGARCLATGRGRD